MKRILTYFVKVERKFTRNGTVKTSLEVCRPILRKNVLATGISFANPRNPRIDRLAAVNVLDSSFTEEEKYVLADIKRADEIRF